MKLETKGMIGLAQFVNVICLELGKSREENVSFVQSRGTSILYLSLSFESGNC